MDEKQTVIEAETVNNITDEKNKVKHKGFKGIIKKYCPVFSLVLFGLFIVAGSIHIACLASERFADFYNCNIGSLVRAALAYLTSWIPFSLAETIIIALPLIAFVLMYFSIKAYKKSEEASVRCIVVLLSILSFMYSIFVLGYGMGYHGSPLSEKLSLEEKAVTSQELKDTAVILLGEIEPLLDEISYKTDGSSCMPYSLDDMNVKLNGTYKEVCKKYTFIQNLKSKLKYIALSEPMTYTHISGVYSYYTGEANLNINFPDYSLPFTAAHELAHQRGIAPENEANFVAFLVCKDSDDAYIRYSAYLNMFEYVTNALYRADP
jgi:hypothetical protein